jgi:hypothetical protein
MLCDYRSACREDCAFQDDRDASIWFEPFYRRKQEDTDNYDRQGKENS